MRLSSPARGREVPSSIPSCFAALRRTGPFLPPLAGEDVAGYFNSAIEVIMWVARP